MSLFKRPDSPFYYTEFVLKGRRVARSTRTASRREAEQYERSLREKISRQAKDVPASPVLDLDHACGKYWLEHGRQLKDARNVRRWLLYITRFMDKALPITDLSTRHVTQFVADMQTARIGVIAINRTVVCLQGVHNRAAKKWERPVKVIVWREQKTRERARVRWITEEDAARFLGELPEHIRRLVLFLLLSGLRKAEAFGLTWGGVHFDRASVTVRVKGGEVREISLSPGAVLVLHECPRDGRFVFDTTNWRRHFERARLKAGIENFRWHDLRHTFATWLGTSGAPLEIIRQQLGHSSVAVTEKYLHVIQREVQDALQKLPTLTPNSAIVRPMKKA